VVESWQKRRPGKVGWDWARRSWPRIAAPCMPTARPDVRQDDRPEFRGSKAMRTMPGSLFFWDPAGAAHRHGGQHRLPSQEVGGGSTIHADFGPGARDAARRRGQGAAGARLGRGQRRSDLAIDVRQPGRRADAQAARGLSRLDELARRIVNGWEEAYEGAWKDIRSDVVLKHRVQPLSCPGARSRRPKWPRPPAGSQVCQGPGSALELSLEPGRRRTLRGQQAGTAGVFSMELHILVWAMWPSPPTSSSCLPITACRSKLAVRPCRPS